jgi:chromosomal replication initiation ATPase DnaA
MTLVHQLALPFPHEPPYAAAAFLDDASNAEAVAWLDRTPDWPAGRLALWGEAGCGKTHLLRRWADRAGADRLEGPVLHGVMPLPNRPLAVDDADRMADEEALLHLLNVAAEAGQPLLLAGREAPARWRVRLPDLASRLRAVTAVRIAPPGDDLLRVLLGRLLLERQLTVPEPVQDWMRRRLPRRAGVMREAAALLDRAQYEAARHVTRRMAEDCLASLLTESDEVSASTPPIAAQIRPLL